MKILGSLKFISFFTFFLQKVICCPSSYTNKQTSFSLINCTPSKMNYYEITILAAKKVVIKNVLQKDPATSNRSNLRFHRKFQLTPPLQQALKFHNNLFSLAVPGIMKNGSLLLLLCMQQKKVQPIYILDKCVVQFSPFCQKKGAMKVIYIQYDNIFLVLCTKNWYLVGLGRINDFPS